MLSRALVVGLGELHDVDAVRAERGADGRRGRGLAGLQLEFEHRADFLLAHGSLVDLFHLLVDLFHLQEVELDRRLAAEHVDQHLELALLGVDLVDLALKSVNGPLTTRTDSPAWNSTRIFGASCFICFWIARTSFSCRGTGLLAEPTKLVTPGVLRTTNHDSFDIFILTRM